MRATTVENLFPEILTNIFEYLDVQSKGRAARVSQKSFFSSSVLKVKTNWFSSLWSEEDNDTMLCYASRVCCALVTAPAAAYLWYFFLLPNFLRICNECIGNRREEVTGFSLNFFFLGVYQMEGCSLQKVLLEGSGSQTASGKIQPTSVSLFSEERHQECASPKSSEIVERTDEWNPKSGEPESLWMLQLVRLCPGWGVQQRPASSQDS